MSDELMSAVDDLIRQATVERSHYYTGNVLRQCKERIEALTAENAKLRALAEWQDISTAPRDGTEFLAYYPRMYGEPAFCEVTAWRELPKELNADSWTIGGVDPTHWKPLEPPQ